MPKPYLPQPEEEGTSNEVRKVQTINRGVEKALEGQEKEKPCRKCKSTNFHYDAATRAKISKYAMKNGNSYAVEKFSKELGGLLVKALCVNLRKLTTVP